VEYETAVRSLSNVTEESLYWLERVAQLQIRTHIEQMEE